MGVKLDVSYPEPGMIGHVKLNDEPIQCMRVIIDMQARELPKATIFANTFPFHVQITDANIITVIGDKAYKLVEVKNE
jgi:hypothetical protein